MIRNYFSGSIGKYQVCLYEREYHEDFVIGAVILLVLASMNAIYGE